MCVGSVLKYAMAAVISILHWNGLFLLENPSLSAAGGSNLSAIIQCNQSSIIALILSVVAVCVVAMAV
jgi:hypothetical protein